MSKLAACILSLRAVAATVDQQHEYLNNKTASTEDTNEYLKKELQKVLDKMVYSRRNGYPNLAISFAWVDNYREIAVSSGKASTSDTFLYGSGTKPFTAAAVMRLVDQGKVGAYDKVYKYVDPYLQNQGYSNLEWYFGSNIYEATVLDVIRMSAGIRDFEDSYEFDKMVLSNANGFWDYPDLAMKFSTSNANINAGYSLYGMGSDYLACYPNSGCSIYSSTSYELAGLLLTAVLQPNSKWYEFDMKKALFDDPSQYPSMSFPTYDPLDKWLTVPGTSVSSAFGSGHTEIKSQDASILGFTCGHMVSTPSSVARFYYYLFQYQSILSSWSANEMMNTKALSKGWSAGQLWYGAGIQYNEYGGYKGNAIATYGHEGATYAFLSASGYAPYLGGAFSVVVNSDGGNIASHSVCPLLQVVQSVVTNYNTNSAGCYFYYYSSMDIHV